MSERPLSHDEEAINLLTQVCVNYRGTLQEHQALQEALKVINSLECVEPAKDQRPNEAK